MEISRFSTLVCLTMVLGCGKQRDQSEQTPTSNRCTMQSSLTGFSAIDELDAMVKSVKLSGSCSLSFGERRGSYRLDIPDQRKFDLSLLAADNSDRSNIVASREQCEGVPYWRVAAVGNSEVGKPASFSWDIREDSNQTVAFIYKIDDGGAALSMNDCR